jgi:hypothetical protein
MRPVTVEEAYKVLTLHALLLSIDEIMVQLDGTTVMQRSLKYAAVRLRKEIDKEIPDIESLFEIDSTAMSALQERASELAKSIFTLTPDQWQIVGETIHITQNPDWLKHRQLKAVLTQPNR